MTPKEERRSAANEKRRAWTKSFWVALRSNPMLYKLYMDKRTKAIKEAFLKRRIEGYFGPSFKGDGLSAHIMSIKEEKTK